MKRVKKSLVVSSVMVCFIGLAYFLLFTWAELPSFLISSGGSDALTGEPYRALVLKRFRMESLKSGDLILVERKNGNEMVREIRRLERVEQPDESQRSRVPQRGRNRTSRQIAQSILDMDWNPRYWVSPTDGTNTTGSIRIEERDIKGKVVWAGGP